VFAAIGDKEGGIYAKFMVHNIIYEVVAEEQDVCLRGNVLRQAKENSSSLG